MLSILYLVQDLADPAVRRRVFMLRQGGANVALAGFLRGDSPLPDFEGIVPVVLGRTHDRRFGQRLMAVAWAAVRHLRGAFAGGSRPDLILARNLEMLALAVRAARQFAGSRLPIVYETLDIHRLLLRRDPLGAAFRAAERRLGRHAKLLITSSPAFEREYFRPLRQIDAPIMLVENKVLAPSTEGTGAADLSRQPGPPWVIGWFGALRCRRSLSILSEFSRRMEGRFVIRLRGRPALTEFDDFAKLVAREPYVEYLGPYRYPDDLAAMYREVHFVWTVDLFEAEGNSRWLLPNRLYEGCRWGAVPIALRDVEVGRYLADRGVGLMLEEPTSDALERLLGPIDGPAHARLTDAIAGFDPANWAHGSADCQTLVDRLRRLVTQTTAS